MAKFKVTLGYETICEVEVEARNAKEAGEMAEWDYGTESCSDTYVVDTEIMDGQISIFDDTYIVPVVEVEVECPPAKEKPLWETMLEAEQRQREMERAGYNEHGVNMRPREDTTGGR